VADIIDLFPPASDDDAPVRTKPHEHCMHRKAIIDEAAHRVYCRECDAELDPLERLLRIANDWERFIRERDRVVRDARVARVRLDELLRQERNARARIRRRGVKVDDNALRDAEREARQRTVRPKAYPPLRPVPTPAA